MYQTMSNITRICWKSQSLTCNLGIWSHLTKQSGSNETCTKVRRPNQKSLGSLCFNVFPCFYVFLLFYTVFRKLHRIRMIMYAKYPKYDASVLCCILLYLVTCSTSVFLDIVLFVSCSILVSLAGTQRVGCTPQIAHHTKLQTAIPSMASQEIAWMAVQASRSC